MNLLCVGINHKTASIDEREKIHMQPDEIRAAMDRLRPDALAECLIVSTCNRTELFAVPVSEDVTTDYLKDFLVSFRGMRDEIPREKFFSLVACGAITHFFEIASGVDSMIVGDSQILPQVREAYRLATEVGAAGPVINRLSHTAFAVGKRVRAETGMMDGAVSISYAAVELASKIFFDLERKHVLLLGAGETAEIAVRILAERGVTNITIANRTRSRAEELVSRVGVGTVIDFEQFNAVLPDADVVITSVSVTEPLVTRDTMKAALHARKKRDPLFIVDIGMPRNVAHEVRDLSNVFLHDIDSLQVIVDQNMARRRAEIPRAQQIVESEANEMFKWLNALDVVPVIRALRTRFEVARHEELDKFRHRFTPEQFELLEHMTRRMMQRLLHAPTVNLKELAGEESQPLSRTELIRLLFDLHPESHDDQPHTDAPAGEQP